MDVGFGKDAGINTHDPAVVAAVQLDIPPSGCRPDDFQDIVHPHFTDYRMMLAWPGANMESRCSHHQAVAGGCGRHWWGHVSRGCYARAGIGPLNRGTHYQSKSDGTQDSHDHGTIIVVTMAVVRAVEMPGPGRGCGSTGHKKYNDQKQYCFSHFSALL